MKSIVETLAAQHRLLESIVGELAAALERGDAGGLQRGLPRLKQALLSHLELEAVQFYPEVLALARAQRETGLLNVAAIFQQNMQTIAQGVGRFFDRHLGKPLDLAAFRKDWGALQQILAQRIADEEEVLHPLHERLIAGRDMQPVP